MAHEVESMFFMGETPWHGLGNRVIDAPTVQEAINQAGLGWVVKTEDVFLANGQSVPAKATVRESDNTILGVVSDRYQVLQNHEAFNFFNPLVESKLVNLEAAGSLQSGKRIWVLARISDNSDLKIVGDDIIRKFILLSNSHDGTLAVRVGFTPVRVICANTLAMAHSSGESSLIRLRHSKSVVKNLDSLRDIINLANQSFEATADQFRALARKQINSLDLRKYIKIVLGHEKTEDKDLSTRAENQITNVIQLFNYGRGMDMVGVKGTAWAAYNAVTEYFTHSISDNADKRYNSLWFGSNQQKNQLALSEALKLAA